MEINSNEEYERAIGTARALLAEDRTADALSFVDGCTGSSGLVGFLKATIYSAARDDRTTLLKGVDLWRQFGPETSAEVAFQLAAALQNVVDLTRATEGEVGVLNQDRGLLREARALYERSANHDDASDTLKLVSLVNCGNLYDSMGREVDALRCYDEALQVDPKFGMALGNRAMALMKVAPFMGGHGSHVLEDAAWMLDRAFEDEARIIEIGGKGALTTFQHQRARLNGDAPRAPGHGNGPQFADEHLRWAYEHGLLLHVSPQCLMDDATSVDPLHLGAMVWSITPEEQARLKRLRDAFNAVKQEFLAARYSLWLASEPVSPVRQQTQAISARGYFGDTLTYARWGIQTGMGIQALTAATNTLDKIAGLLHLYFATGRKPKDVSFYSLWHAPKVKGQPAEVEPVFAEQVSGFHNEGLTAILDLSCEIEGDENPTTLKEQIARRHAATHRYLVAHDLPMYEPDEAKWLERTDWSAIVAGTIEQLRVTRAALIYFARAIQAREASRSHDGKTIPTLETWPIVECDA